MRRTFAMTALAASALALTTLAGCEPDGPRGLHPALVPGQPVGPSVVFDPTRKPDPEIPFPNDLATRIGEDGATTLNVSLDGATEYERWFRRHLGEVPSFSGMTPISVAFDGPLDLSTVNDETVFVVNVEPGSPRFGERLALDLGRGWFPHQAVPHAYLPNDPLAGFDSFVLPPGNQVDSDEDGWPDQWVYHYEVATHTLDIRPLLPMEAGARYAVVLTRGIQGWNADGGKGSIRSPFPFVNHEAQTEDLRRALPALAEAGVEVEDIAFAWTLKTGDLAATFRALRDGLYGEGKFAWLAEQFPPGIAEVYDLSVEHDGDASHPDPSYQYPFVARDHRFILQGPYIGSVMNLIGSLEGGFTASFDHVDYAVFGEMDTPDFRATPDKVWDLDLKTGRATVGAERVPFLLTVPKTTEHHKPPFPVVIHAHATATSRIEGLLLADKMAAAGIALFSIDAVGHGPVLTDVKKLLLDYSGGETSLVTALVTGLLGPLVYPDHDTRFSPDMTLDEAIDVLNANGFMQQLTVKGRAIDFDGDCYREGGEAYYTPDAFQMRDAMRQTTLDYMVGVRMLRSLRPDAVPPAIADVRKATADQLRPNLLAGDFNADGVLDVGGPDVPMFMMGVSLGGIHTSLTAPLEPHIQAAAPIVAGAGLADIFIRTKLHGVVTPIMHQALGPVIVACPQADGTAHLSWNDDSDECKKSEVTTWVGEDGQCLSLPEQRSIVQATVTLPPGARVRATNLGSGEVREGTADGAGRLALPIPADFADEVMVEVLAPDGRVAAQADLVSPYQGLAKTRNTPEFRRAVQRVANVLEGADAITVADRVLRAPLPGYPATNTLLTLAAGDQTVNFAAGMALARAMGLFGPGDDEGPEAPWRPYTEEIIALGGLTNPQVAPPTLDPGRPEGGPGMCKVVATVAGQPARSGLCIADVRGHHEYIASAKGSDAFGEFEVDGKTYEGTYTEYHQNLITAYFHSLARAVPQDPCWASAACVADRDLMKAWRQPVGATGTTGD